MNRARFGVAAALVAVTVGVSPALAQQAPNLTPVLAGKKFATPVKGEANVEFTKANVEPVDKKTNIVVKLLAKSPDDRYQSAYGLLRDLEHCHDAWREHRRIDSFPLGQHRSSSIDSPTSRAT